MIDQYDFWLFSSLKQKYLYIYSNNDYTKKFTY